jgi:hypothetical protein
VGVSVTAIFALWYHGFLCFSHWKKNRTFVSLSYASLARVKLGNCIFKYQYSWDRIFILPAIILKNRKHFFLHVVKYRPTHQIKCFTYKLRMSLKSVWRFCMLHFVACLCCALKCFNTLEVGFELLLKLLHWVDAKQN